jgi:hypothetical protein
MIGIRGNGSSFAGRLSKAHIYRPTSSRAFATGKTAQSDSKPSTSKSSEPVEPKPHAEVAKQTSKKPSTTDLDEELRKRMDGLSGDGGEAGVEYEDGKPVAMKRSVKNNMFRYI